MICTFLYAFNKESITTFLGDTPDDALYTQIKVVSIVAINGLLRLNEIVSFEWSNISLGSIDEGSESTPMIQMSVLRSKRTGPKAMKKFIISDALSTEILTRYMNSFDIKTGRFFRKLNENLKPTMSPIGQKTISIYLLVPSGIKYDIPWIAYQNST